MDNLFPWLKRRATEEPQIKNEENSAVLPEQETELQQKPEEVPEQTPPEEMPEDRAEEPTEQEHLLELSAEPAGEERTYLVGNIPPPEEYIPEPAVQTSATSLSPKAIQAFRSAAILTRDADSINQKKVHAAQAKTEIIAAQTPVEPQAADSGETISYHDSTYEIVSKIAYLIGVDRKYFDAKEMADKDPAVYRLMDLDKNARIIRHLCIIRNAIEHNFKNINDKMRREMRTIVSMHEYIPMRSMMQLSEDGVSFIKKTSTQLVHHIIEINRLIVDRINNCKTLFPLWLKWEYVQKLFVMPNGLCEEGTRAAADLFYQYKSYYPYQIYINWKPQNVGNILHNDKKFVTLLYRWHKDEFRDLSKVTNVSSYVKGGIYDFIEDSRRVVVLVDCENSDPYKLSAVFRNLDKAITAKIARIILFDDVNTVAAWKTLGDDTEIPVEHMLIERIKKNKSLVDIKLTARACEEYYKNDTDAFILVSSDSDFWGLISSLQDARFLVLIERKACGPDLKKALVAAGIFYCYIDDFYAGNIENILMHSLFSEMYRYLDENVSLNLHTMLQQALHHTRITMSAAERMQFYDKYVKTMQMTIDEQGNVTFSLGQK